MDADAHIEIFAFVTQLLFELQQTLLHVDGRRDRVSRVLRVVLRCAPERHDGIADKLVQRAAVTKDDRDLQAEIAVEEGHDLFRGVAFRHGGEAAYIGKKHGDVARLTAQRLRRFALRHQGCDHARVEKTVEHAHGLFARFFLAQILAERGRKIKSPAEQQGGEQGKTGQACHREILGGQQHDAHRQECAADLERVDTFCEQRQLQRDEQQGRERREINRSGGDVPLVLEIVDGRGEYRGARIQVGYRCGADVMQAGRAAADDDDLAAQLVCVAQRFLP